MKKYQIVSTGMHKDMTFSIKLIGKNQNLHKIQEALLLLAVVLDFKIDMN